MPASVMMAEGVETVLVNSNPSAISARQACVPA